MATKKRIRIEFDITADHHKQNLPRQLLSGLADDAASEISAHEAIEGNSVEAISVEVVRSQPND